MKNLKRVLYSAALFFAGRAGSCGCLDFKMFRKEQSLKV